MENMNMIIANNLKRLREEKKISLDKVALLTGVSKSMLGQIERGESNPTISTVWKIANGLKVSFTALIKEPQADNVLVQRQEVEPLIEDHGKFRLYPFFPYTDGQRFEVFTADMDKGAYLDGAPHGENTIEVVTVFDGELTMRLEDEEIIVKAGDAIKFRTDKAHIYHNTYSGLTRINIVIYYPESSRYFDNETN